MGKLFASVIQDVDGNGSSKRVYGLIAIGCLVAALVSEMWGHAIHDHLLDVFASVTGISTVGATVEHFAPRGGQQ